MRLIDADKLSRELREIADYPRVRNTGKTCDLANLAFHFLALMVDDEPTIDAVPVVRCKDCIYRPHEPNTKGFFVCNASGMEIRNDDFCSYGERKEGADNA